MKDPNKTSEENNEGTNGIMSSEDNDKKRKSSSISSSPDINTFNDTANTTASTNTNTNTNLSTNNNQQTKNDAENNNPPKKTTKPKPKKIKTKHLNPLILSLRRTLQICCATNDFHTAIEAYKTMHIEQKVTMESQSFYNLLNLCEGGLGGERGIHVGTPKPGSSSSKTVIANVDVKTATIGNDTETNTNTNTNNNNAPQDNKQQKEGEEKVTKQTIEYTQSQRKEYAYQIKNEMNALQIPLNETAYTALMRILTKPENNNLDEAEALLQQAEITQQCKPKLRMYSCLIDAFCNENNNDLVGALRIWNRMNHLERKDKNGNLQLAIEPTEREYCSLMKCATRIGDVRVMDRVVSEIAEDVLVPSLDTKDAILSWFQSDYSVVDDVQDDNSSALDNITELSACNAPSMGPLQYVITKEDKEKKTINTTSTTEKPLWRITIGDTIDTKTGTLQTGCLKGHALKPVQLDKESWKNMIEMNEEIVVKGEIAEHGKISKFAGGGKGKKRFVPKDAVEKRRQQWESFKQFLIERVGPPCNETNSSEGSNDAIGKKRFDVVIDGANVGYYKRNFSNAPKYVDYKQIDWVVDHFRNQGKSVLLFMHARHFGRNLMPRWADIIVKKWDENGTLYRTPHGSNDDWFWMHAALWCGRGTMVLSNDLMRDHHFQMLAHRSFLRWKERHQIYFDFGSWEGKKRHVKLMYPDVYSRRIQRVGDFGLAIPLPKRGDENRFLDGFHEADETAPTEETYVCIHL